LSVADERIKDGGANPFRDAATGVFHAHFKCRAGIYCFNDHGAIKLRTGFACVQDQVEENTLEFTRVEKTFQIARGGKRDAGAAKFALGIDRFNGPAYDLIEARK